MSTKRVSLMCAIVALTSMTIANPASGQPTLYVRYVDGDVASATGNGQSWEAAYKYLQDALSEAETLSQLPNSEVELWVAATDPQNPYRPDRDANHPTGTFEGSSFEMLDHVSLLGGFAATEQYNYERDAAVNVTVLSGLDYWEGNPEYPYNSEHVLIADAVGDSAVIDGFTITNPAIPQTTPGGRGMWINDASPFVIRCTFKNNHGRGAAIAVNGEPSQPEVYNCTFADNAAISTCPLGQGGAVWNAGSDVLFVNCLFHDNYASHHGGAIYNVVGGINPDYDKLLTLINCTFAENSAGLLGGGIYNCCDMVLKNVILWDNTDSGGSDESAQIETENHQSTVIDYSCVKGWTGNLGGTGNDGNDPLFADGANDDFRLSDGSLSIDKGDNASIQAYPDQFDLDVDANTSEATPDLDVMDRIRQVTELTVDRGACEFIPDCPADVNDDGVVNVLDLLAVLAAWGPCSGCPEDINGDNTVNVLDLLAVLGTWKCGGTSQDEAPQSVLDCIDKYSQDIELMIGCIEAILETEE
jgi:hypothetical protein